MRRRVAALVVVLARLVGGHHVLAEPPVHERRLADAGGAEQDGRRAGGDAGPERIAAVAGQRRHDVHRDADRDRLHLRDERPRVFEPVRLRQDDLRVGAALPDRDEVALDSARLEVRAERGHDERNVDVGSQGLGGGGEAGRVADDRAAARQDRANQPVPEADPVADPDVEAVVQGPPG